MKIMKITRAKGRMEERKVEVSDLTIPDLCHVKEFLNRIGEDKAAEGVLECWHLAHDMLLALRDLEKLFRSSMAEELPNKHEIWERLGTNLFFWVPTMWSHDSDVRSWSPPWVPQEVIAVGEVETTLPDGSVRIDVFLPDYWRLHPVPCSEMIQWTNEKRGNSKPVVLVPLKHYVRDPGRSLASPVLTWDELTDEEKRMFLDNRAKEMKWSEK